MSKSFETGFPAKLGSNLFDDNQGWRWQLDVHCLGCQPSKIGNDFIVTYSAEASIEVTEDILNSLGFDGTRLMTMSHHVPRISQSYSVQKKLVFSKIDEIGHKFQDAVTLKFIQIFDPTWKRERVKEIVENLIFSPFGLSKSDLNTRSTR
jgi:hypothetical protein